MAKNKNYPRSEISELKEQIQNLKGEIKSLQKDKKELLKMLNDTNDNPIYARLKKLEKRNNSLRNKIRKLQKQKANESDYMKRYMKEIDVQKVLDEQNEEIDQTQICPKCGKKIKINNLPFGKMELCTNCNYTKVFKL